MRNLPTCFLLCFCSCLWISLIAGPVQADRYALRGSLESNQRLIAQTERQFGVRLRRGLNAVAPIQRPATEIYSQARSHQPVGERRPVAKAVVAPVTTNDDVRKSKKRASIEDSNASVNDEDNADEDSDNDNDNDNDVDVTLSSSIGFDSNIDEETVATGSAFHRHDAQVSANFETDETELELEATATIVDLLKKENFSRWRMALAAEAERNFGNGSSGTLGISIDHDGLDSDTQTVEDRVFLKLEKTNNVAGLSLLGSLGFSLEPGSPAAIEDEDAEARMDSRQASLETAIALRPGSILSPYLRLGIVDVTRPGQNLQEENLNASGEFIVVGVRYRPHDELKLDVGAHFERRRFDATELDEADMAFVDVSLIWKPSSRVTFEASANRSFDDPDSGETEFGEITTYKSGIELQLSSQTELSLSAAMEDTRKLISDEKTREFTFEGEASHALSERLGVFVAVKHLTSETMSPEEEPNQFKRTQFRLGIRTKL